MSESTDDNEHKFIKLRRLSYLSWLIPPLPLLIKNKSFANKNKISFSSRILEEEERKQFTCFNMLQVAGSTSEFYIYNLIFLMTNLRSCFHPCKLAIHYADSRYNVFGCFQLRPRLCVYY